MKSRKNLKGAIVLGLTGLMMVAASQLTIAEQGESATVIIGASVYDAECFDGGLCIIPGESVDVENLTSSSGYYGLTWIWHSGGLIWNDVVQIFVNDFGCTGHSICEIKTTLSVQDQGLTDFGFHCEWNDSLGQWTGEIVINNDRQDCLYVNFNVANVFAPVCSWNAEAINDVHNHFGTGYGAGQC